MNCNICKQNASCFAQAQVLNKYTVQYFRCSYCGFVQTQEPYWLEEAYTNAITDSDIGLVNRNMVFSKITESVLRCFFDTQAKFMDYGGGYGLFVRMMRDAGFDFYRFDQYCENIFAKGFEADRDVRNQYELVTAFEVFEHLIHPLDDIERMLHYADSILFSTVLMPASLPRPGEWWYYGLEHGQHVALYAPETVSYIAETFGLKVYSGKNSLYLLTKKKIPSFLFKVATNYKISVLFSTFFMSQKKTLLIDDYRKVNHKNLI